MELRHRRRYPTVIKPIDQPQTNNCGRSPRPAAVVSSDLVRPRKSHQESSVPAPPAPDWRRRCAEIDADNHECRGECGSPSLQTHDQAWESLCQGAPHSGQDSTPATPASVVVRHHSRPSAQTKSAAHWTMPSSSQPTDDLEVAVHHPTHPDPK